MGKKFKWKAMLLHCVFCHETQNTLKKLDGLYICTSCLKRLDSGEVITTPDGNYSVRIKEGKLQFLKLSDLEGTGND